MASFPYILDVTTTTELSTQGGGIFENILEQENISLTNEDNVSEGGKSTDKVLLGILINRKKSVQLMHLLQKIGVFKVS